MFYVWWVYVDRRHIDKSKEVSLKYKHADDDAPEEYSHLDWYWHHMNSLAEIGMFYARLFGIPDKLYTKRKEKDDV